MTPSRPTLRYERALLRTGVTALACADEAGRGALSGPVSVGVVVITAGMPAAPAGVRDSKLLTPARRQELVPSIRLWAAHAVGMASAQEIDRIGIVAALRLAGQRALAALPCTVDAVLLDGNHDYLTPPDYQDTFVDGPAPVVPPVITRVKADLTCAGVAAASIVAKTSRDAVMVDLGRDFPEYRWHLNKGYGAPDHVAALRRFGPTVHHRHSWQLPTGRAAGHSDPGTAPRSLSPSPVVSNAAPSTGERAMK